MKTIIRYLFLFIFFASCNVSNSHNENIETHLKIENRKISNLQDVAATFTIVNDTDETKEYQFATGCQFAFKINQVDKNIFNSEEYHACTLATSSFILKEKENKTFSLSNFLDFELESGNYTIKAYLIGYEDEVNASKEFVVVN